MRLEVIEYVRAARRARLTGPAPPAELATRLLVKERTAKHVVASLLNKIGAGTRIEAPKCAAPGPARARVGPRDPRGDVTGNTKMILVR